MIGERTVNSSLPHNFVRVNMYQCLKILQKKFYFVHHVTKYKYIIYFTYYKYKQQHTGAMYDSQPCMWAECRIFCILISTQYLITL